jgi:hypothetical protein
MFRRAIGLRFAERAGARGSSDSVGMSRQQAVEQLKPKRGIFFLALRASRYALSLTGTRGKLKAVPYALGALLFALGVLAHAQQPQKIPRLGYISGTGMPRIKDHMSMRCAKGSEILDILNAKTF